VKSLNNLFYLTCMLYTLKTLVLTALLFLCFPGQGIAQEDEDAWDAYIAQFDGGPGSVILNMSVKQRAPVSKFPYVLVTGVTFKDCGPEGFPSQDEFPKLHIIHDSVQAVIKSVTSFINAGSFTHQCERLDYVYVSDTQNLRSRLEVLYSKQFSNYKPYINIKEDRQWEYYLSFLYPNDQTLNYMSDLKVVERLSESGDKLEKPRQVDHFIYFKTQKDRDEFVEFIRNEKYKIEDKSFNKENKQYSAHISRVDKVDISSINEVTEYLRKTAIRFKGDYNGWETFVIKD
jgi:uncharacterized protein (TIGR01619 family)